VHVASRDLMSLRNDDLQVPVARHQFSLGVIAKSLALKLHGGLRLKQVPDVLKMHWQWSGLGDVQSASYYSIRLWLMRLGLHQLLRPKEQADDWMWIIDHTIQLGDRKCLLVLGIRQSTWDALHRDTQSRVLSHKDVVLIDLVPVTKSNGRVVYRQLRAAAEKNGIPRVIVSDGGSDLHAGVKQFQKFQKHFYKKLFKKLRKKFLTAYPTTVWVYDIKHKVACMLKHALERDASWSAFTKKVDQFKKQVSLTSLAALAPPSQRSKSRYMNLDVLVKWAKKTLSILDNPRVMRAAELNVRKVKEKLGWLRKFAQPLRRWGEMLDMVGAAEHSVRHEGIHRAVAKELNAQLPKSTIPAVQRLRKQLLEFIQSQGQQAREGERLLGSSEVLESIFGAFKHIAGEGGHHGLTGMILSIGALVGNLDVTTILTALTEVTTPSLWEWCRTHLGPTVQSLRQRLRQAINAEQKQKTLCLKTA